MLKIGIRYLNFESKIRFLIMHKRTGKCLCGAVRFEVKGDPEMLHACHCRNCQLMTGSAFAICLYFPKQDITITSGDLTTFVRSCD